jgi:hypothetical protein
VSGVQHEWRRQLWLKAYNYLPQISSIILRTIWWSTENNIWKFWTRYGPLQGGNDTNVNQFTVMICGYSLAINFATWIFL